MTKSNTIRARDLHEKWMRDDTAYRKAYEELEEEFSLADALISARSNAGLTQAQLARRMNTTQTAIARLESGRTKPSTRTLERYATATGHSLRISFEKKPRGSSARRSRLERVG